MAIATPFFKFKTMYKLKDEYKGCTVSTGGYAILLDNVKSQQVETLGLKDYFTKTKKKAVLTKDK